MTKPKLSTEWKKSTFSHGNGGNCVEAQRTGTGAAVRDTQNRHLGHLEADSTEWTALLEAVKGSAP
ncbi:DUF397 domain-containing protein [Nocardiopsis sp. HUAS JQ3]|uniref:DUF397 domain-containing protein n=1 Tax=Nocardiopsis sp. HUAS JQ3 TaxID=3061629 RepID=UPI0023A9CD5D|nr:DUF397 domain-containing protein [Nocardiopsis sp. HUAS JQ3]WDZ92605.1 DUF397 domain-containing protein [Nocardiopsis sp. HUAS JQ3]